MRRWAPSAKWFRPGKSRPPVARKLTLSLVAFACLLSLPAAAADAHTNLRFSVRVEPIVLMIVTDSSGAPIKGWGHSSATLSLPIISGKSSVTADIDASGQPNNNGCTIFARLSAPTPAIITVNAKQISSTGDILVADAPAYPSSAALAIEATGHDSTLPAILLSCRPK